MSNRYYAETCPYGITAKSRQDTLIWFESEDARDAFVAKHDAIDEANGGTEFHCQALTPAEAHALYGDLRFAAVGQEDLRYL